MLWVARSTGICALPLGGATAHAYELYLLMVCTSPPCLLIWVPHCMALGLPVHRGVHQFVQKQDPSFGWFLRECPSGDRWVCFGHFTCGEVLKVQVLDLKVQVLLAVCMVCLRDYN